MKKGLNRGDNIMSMDIDYIVIQAGGKGTRMGHLTANKPKGIVPVDNLPIIFHLFRKYPHKHFVIICDYLHEVMEKYLACFADVDYQCVVANGVGTCGGIKEAFSLVPPKKPFMLIWSDLILSDAFQMPMLKDDAIGISESFECRWSFIQGVLTEQRSASDGVAGCFIFQNSTDYQDVPSEGEFVRYLSQKKKTYDRFSMQGSCEVGTLLAYEAKKQDYVCRPFNALEIKSDRIIKKPITQQGCDLSKKEENWYRHAQKIGVKSIPHIFSYSPLEMELVDGKNPFKLQLDETQKQKVVQNAIDALRNLHALETAPADFESIVECYYDKTYDRISKIQNLVPFASAPSITINGKAYLNPFDLKKKVRGAVEAIASQTKQFQFIHGDSTFSNLLVKSDLSVYFIDPRGYFGRTLLYGDPFYDWAKLYYSIAGNYDQFNAKNFQLDIHADGIGLSVKSNGYESLTSLFLSNFSKKERTKIHLLHVKDGTLM